MTAFRYGTLSLDYHDSGSGPLTLVLLPGWCEPKTVFAPFIALAEQHFRVISLDWRGHALSGRDEQLSLGAEELLADLRQLLLELQVGKCVTLSVAHASWIAVALAESLPQQVQGMVFLDWIMTQPDPAFFDSVQHMQRPERWVAARDALFSFWQGGIVHPQVKHHLTVEMAKEDFRVWQAAGVAIEQAYRQYLSPLNRLDALTLHPACCHIYALDRDDDYLRQQQRFAEVHSFFSVVRLEHASTHLGILECPESVYQAVICFLERNSLPV